MVDRREHPQRRSLVSEMHLRRWPPVTAPAQLIQVLRIVAPDEREAERAALEHGAADLAPSDNPKHREGRIAGIRFVWEAHTEASVVTLFIDLASLGMPAAAFAPGLDSHPAVAAALNWLDTLPGETLRATRIALVATEAEAAALLPLAGFIESDLVSCRVGDPVIGNPRMWSDFRLGAGGYGHLLVAANGAGGGDLARVVQRLQELGCYRNLTLLGLPVAQAAWPDLARIEEELTDLAGVVVQRDTTDDVLLEKVTALSLELMAISASGSFRMSATTAYARLVEERLAELAPRAIAGYLSLTDFTQRRLLPAVRTCAAYGNRIADLSARTDRFAALLRTRIETRIENQNARLLKSMERSASLQLRLQQLVEGLSVVALSYYGISLLAYMLKAAEKLDHDIESSLLIGGAVPVVVFGMWWGLHRMKQRLLGEH